jgi:hypothetical protein
MSNFVSKDDSYEHTQFLASLIPNPIRINDGLSGEIYIDGNINQNQILFRFKFDNEEEVSPVLIYIELSGIVYKYCCYTALVMVMTVSVDKEGKEG